MPGNSPILQDSPEDRARAKAWQGGLTFAFGTVISVGTWFCYGFVWWGTIAIAIGGLFWMLAGLITMFSGYE
jgi:hypothetical protein